MLSSQQPIARPHSCQAETSRSRSKTLRCTAAANSSTSTTASTLESEYSAMWRRQRPTAWPIAALHHAVSTGAPAAAAAFAWSSNAPQTPAKKFAKSSFFSRRARSEMALLVSRRCPAALVLPSSSPPIISTYSAYLSSSALSSPSTLLKCESDRSKSKCNPSHVDGHASRLRSGAEQSQPTSACGSTSSRRTSLERTSHVMCGEVRQ
mmetsp:Transcript_22588/g.72459  ORF Transcript_22588/g.72459 Transcript_22588/m.72459 type:complete len:208 (+) Transcript_22588:201-824(+)